MRDLLDYRRQILSRTIPVIRMGMNDGVRDVTDPLENHSRDKNGYE